MKTCKCVHISKFIMLYICEVAISQLYLNKSENEKAKEKRRKKEGIREERERRGGREGGKKIMPLLAINLF